MQLAGLGTTVVFALAAVVWLGYLVPVWVRRREFVATERNAVRLQQTLRIMAETAEVPHDVVISATTRDIARQHRVAAKEARLQQAIARAAAVSKARELDEQIKRVEREVRAAVASSVSRNQRLRRTRLACTSMLLASVGVGIAGALLPQAMLLLVLAGVVATLAVVGLAAVHRTNASVREVAQTMEHERLVIDRQAQSSALEAELVSRSWTPVPVPAQRATRAPIDVLRDHARRIVAEGEGAEVTPIGASFERLISGEVEVDEPPRRVVDVEPAPLASTAARTEAPVAAAVLAPPSRFARMGVIDDEDASFDVCAAFRRRVG